MKDTLTGIVSLVTGVVVSLVTGVVVTVVTVVVVTVVTVVVATLVTGVVVTVAADAVVTLVARTVVTLVARTVVTLVAGVVVERAVTSFVLSPGAVVVGDSVVFCTTLFDWEYAVCVESVETGDRVAVDCPRFLNLSLKLCTACSFFATVVTPLANSEGLRKSQYVTPAAINAKTIMEPITIRSTFKAFTTIHNRVVPALGQYVAGQSES